MEIPEMLRQILGKAEHPIIIGQVKDVDTTKFTCTVAPVDGSAQLSEVRLSPSFGKFALVSIPKVDSFVMVAMVSKVTGYIVLCDEAEKVIIRSEEYGGLVKVGELVSRLNAIENAFNGFLDEYKLHTHSGVPPSTYPTATLLYPSTQTKIQTTQQDQLENKEVLHG